MVLGIVVHFVCVSWSPVHNTVAFINSIADPMESHVHCLRPFCLISLFDILAAHELSTWIGDAGCGWPISFSVTCIGADFWKL